MKATKAFVGVTWFLLRVSPKSVMAQEPSVCAPSCGPFGECVTCGFADDCTGEFCRCKAGYEGFDCSEQVEYCPQVDAPGSVPSCRNGGRCVVKEIMANPDEFGEAQEVWRCDCSTAVGSAKNPVQHAGAQCEFATTQSCLVGGTASNYAFCVNGGDCVRKIARNEEHPGCTNCPEYEGRHCQYRKGEAPPEELAAERRDVEGDEHGLKPGFIVVIVMLSCLVLGGLGLFAARRASEKDQNTQAAVAHASDVPTDLALEEKASEAGKETVQPTTHDSEEDEEDKATQPQVV